jgi:hypothetical protein
MPVTNYMIRNADQSWTVHREAQLVGVAPTQREAVDLALLTATQATRRGVSSQIRIDYGSGRPPVSLPLVEPRNWGSTA